MDFKKSILILIMAIFLTSIAGVCAGDANDTPIASDDANQIVVSSNDIMTEDSLKTSEEDTTFAQTDDESVSAAVDSEILGEGNGTYEDLRDEIGNGGNKSLARSYYNYTGGDTIEITTPGVINGNGAVIDMAGSTIRAFTISTSGVTIKNLTIKNANYNGNGGAIYFSSSGTVTNCNFTNNTASGSGGAVNMGSGTVTNCNFTNNQATYGGGAIFMSSGSVTNCNFTGNKATGTNSWGGAVWMNSGSVENCNFTNNTATSQGGAIRFSSTGTVSNCNFTGNTASGDSGAVYFKSTGNVTNCNFTNNKATDDGGAVYFWNAGNVTNCNFADNTAYRGGAVYFSSSGNVSNCNFTNNQASVEGGAIMIGGTGNVTNCNFTDNQATGFGSLGGAIMIGGTGTVTNCNFVNNSATYHGCAVYFSNNGEVRNCNFTDNKATDTYSYGGAVYFWNQGTVTNCNFTGNNATMGSAILFYSPSATKTVSNSRFLNNRANAEALEITKNDNNITITFTGNNNLLNAIYSNSDVTFTNVTYWAANRIANTGSSPTTPARSKYEAGQNITVGVVVNGNLVLSDVMVTDEKGTIVLNINAGDNYYISVRHDADSYYTEAERTITNNTKFNVNVTSQTTTNKTVNITAKSNIYSGVMPGKLLFILPNSTEINANYAGNGTWWAVHTFDDYKDYEINATYVRLDNVTINNGTISITKANSTVDIGDIVFNYGDSKNVTVSTNGATGITAKIKDVPVSVVDNYTIVISGLAAGYYTLTVTTIPDDDHNPVNKTAKITVNKLKTQLSAGAVTTTYNINKNLVITLKDAKGKALSGVKVTVNLNGAKTYTTDKNGQIKVPTKGLVPKAYTAKIAFNGNSNYVKSAKNVKVTVKKATPKLTAKKKTFKAKTKVKKYTITLKNNLGKAIKKAKVTLKVKGKTYKATTNSKGKATFKIKNLKKKGKYTAVIKFKGNKYYKAITKKVKLTVKASKVKKSTFKTVSEGSNDEATVKKIQQALKDHGYYLTYDGHYLMVDGKFESCTERSVREFQHDKGLKVTGKVDEKTAKKLGLI